LRIGSRSRKIEILKKKRKRKIVTIVNSVSS
jgi:hypothetical protein